MVPGIWNRPWGVDNVAGLFIFGISGIEISVLVEQGKIYSFLFNGIYFVWFIMTIEFIVTLILRY